MRRRHAALVAIALVLVTSCGTKVVAEKLTDTNTLVADALAQIRAASTYHLLISYSAGIQEDFTADLRIKLPSDAVGTVTENGASINVLQTGGNLYVQGEDFVGEYGGSYEAKLYGNRWILATADLLRTTVLDVAQLTTLPSRFLGLDFSGARVDHVVAATESTAELDSTWGSIYISELPPHRLVKVESKTGFVLTTGFSNVNFELLEYNDPVNIQVPTDVADPNNPATLPPFYELQGSWKWGRCDYLACGFTATVQNHGGTHSASGPSTYTFRLLTDPAKRFIDKCTGRIPVVANAKTVNIGCLVSSRAFQAYTGRSVYGDLLIDNPSYEG